MVVQWPIASSVGIKAKPHLFKYFSGNPSPLGPLLSTLPGRSQSLLELPTPTVPLAVFPLKEWITSQHVTFLVHYLISHLLSKGHMKKIQDFLTISLPLQKLDPLCLWFLGNGRSGRWSLTELGVGALNLHLHQSSSTPTRAAAAASGLQRLQGLSWESSSRLELSDSKDRASRATRPIFSRPINMSDFLY